MGWLRGLVSRGVDSDQCLNTLSQWDTWRCEAEGFQKQPLVSATWPGQWSSPLAFFYSFSFAVYTVITSHNHHSSSLWWFSSCRWSLHTTSTPCAGTWMPRGYHYVPPYVPQIPLVRPPEMDLPKNWLYLRTSCGGDPQQGWSNVEASVLWLAEVVYGKKMGLKLPFLKLETMDSQEILRVIKGCYLPLQPSE